MYKICTLASDWGWLRPCHTIPVVMEKYRQLPWKCLLEYDVLKMQYVWTNIIQIAITLVIYACRIWCHTLTYHWHSSGYVIATRRMKVTYKYVYKNTINWCCGSQVILEHLHAYKFSGRRTGFLHLLGIFNG